MMAVGLNIVVGYAGLLDLGYVAFYAMGAYTAGVVRLAAVPEQATFHFGGVGDRSRASPGIHISIWLVLSSPGVVTALVGHHDRPADAAAARRLPRDRDARLRRDHPADRAQRRQPLRHGLQPHERPERDQRRSTRPGFGNALARRDGRLPARELPACCDASLGHQSSTDVFYWTALVLRADHRLLLVAAPRLAARPRVDRDPRGRDRRRRDGRPADADEDVGVRDGRVLRRRRRRLLRELQERRRSRATSSSTSPSSSSAWSSSAGWATSGASSSVPHSCPISNQEGLANIGAWMNANGRQRLRVSQANRRAALHVGVLRGVILVLTMLFRPEGLIPSQRREGPNSTRASTTSISMTWSIMTSPSPTATTHSCGRPAG